MKTVVKILTALAAVVGVAYVIATYGDKIVAWCKNLLNACPCKCDAEDCADCECEMECPCEEAPAEEAVAEEPAAEEAAEEPAAEEAVAEEPVIEESAPIADEEDFEG
ncbi:MAG: hypothetical protein J6C98_02205 [Oscillospiraceae bacterium]|nr:hypothetical protein [Oscillospiraceae bacterium]